MSKTTSVGTVYYLYDGEDILAEIVAAGNLLTYYIHGPGIDEPLAMVKGTQVYFYHADALGTITRLTSASGAVVQSYEYDSFGTITAQSGSLTQPYMYTAREWDAETGLYYYRARYYDPQVGRFITEDPLQVLGDEEVNHYAYVRNNPVNAIDPLGLFIVGCSKKQPDKPRYEPCKNLPPAQQAACKGAVETVCKSHPAIAVHCCVEDYKWCYAEAIRTNNDQLLDKCRQDYQECMTKARKGNPQPPIIH